MNGLDGSQFSPKISASMPTTPAVEHMPVDAKMSAVGIQVLTHSTEPATEILPAAQVLTKEKSKVSLDADLSPAAPGESPSTIHVSIPDMSLEKVKERGQQAAHRSIDFGKQWLTEYRDHPAIQRLEIGQGYSLSRREIQQLAKEGKLPPDLAKLYETEGFPRSVVIMKVAEDRGEHPFQAYEFFAKRHEHELAGKRGSTDRPQTEMERADSKELKQILGEGGINELVCLDCQKGETQALHRQTKIRNPDTERKLLKQQKTEVALKNAPNVFNHKCMAKHIDPADHPPGIRKLQGTVYAKMAMDGKKLFNYKEEGHILADPNNPEVPKAAPAAKALKALNQVATGMASMHEKNIVWRDMKMENLLVDQEGNVHIADFDTCEHLDDPTDKVTKKETWDEESQTNRVTESRTNELTSLDIEGTYVHLAPWVTGLSCASFVESPATKHIKVVKEKLAAADNDQARKEIVKPFLEKADTYSLAQTTYLLMTGEYPPYFMTNAKSFNPLMAITKNNRDRDMRPSTEAFPLPEGCEWKPSIMPDPLTQNAANLIEGLNKGIKNGYPPELAELVWRGLSSMPDEVPTAQEFRDTTQKFLKA